MVYSGVADVTKLSGSEPARESILTANPSPSDTPQSPVARELAPAGWRSRPKTCAPDLNDSPSRRVMGLLRKPAGASSLATEVNHFQMYPIQIVGASLLAKASSQPTHHPQIHLNPLWRGSLLPLGGEAAPNPEPSTSLTTRVAWFRACCASQREQEGVHIHCCGNGC